MKTSRRVLPAVVLSLFFTQSLAQWAQVPGMSSAAVISLAIRSDGRIFAGTFSDGAYSSNLDGTMATLDLGQLYGVYEVFSLAIDSSGNIYAGTLGKGLLRSTNIGLSWTYLSNDVGPNNLPMGDVYSVQISASGAIIASDNGSLYRSSNGGSSWAEVKHSTNGVGGFRSIACGRNDTAYACGTIDWFYYSTNDGANWTWVGSSSGLTSGPYTITSGSGGLLFAGTQGGGVFKSTNHGLNWTAVNNKLTSSYVNTLATNPAEIVFAGTNGGVFHSSDNGGSWEVDTSGLVNKTIQAIAFDPSGNTFVGAKAGTHLGGLWKSDALLPIEIVSFTASPEAGRVVLRWTTATELNNYGFEVEKGALGTNLWTKFGFVKGRGTTLEQHHYSFVDSNAVHGGWSYRLRQIDLDGSTSYFYAAPIDVPTPGGDANVPNSLSLSQNYPNPCNPRTTIVYDVPGVRGVPGEWITLKVFDLLGNEVATLVNGQREGGKYSVGFDASSLASGVYFYRLQAADLVRTKHLVVVK